jgi:sugar lactone lactonase YvrE
LACAALALAPAAEASSDYATPYAFTTLSGIAGLAGVANGKGTIALFNMPIGIGVDAVGNVYVADSGNATVRKITASGVVSTFAGSPGSQGTQDGTGAAAQFGVLVGLAVDANGNVYVSDAHFNTIRKITPAGVVSTLAGSSGITGHADGNGTAAQFNQPNGLGVDAGGNVYVADSGNDTIRKITPSGSVSTLAGAPGVLGHVDGPGASARFNDPDGVAADAGGNVYVADYDDTIRKITPAGVVSTLAGITGVTGSADGTGAGALFNLPAGLAVDANDNVYVTDSGNNTIRLVTPAGLVTTLAGRVGSPGSANGTGTAALFNGPLSVAVDGNGNLYVSDAYNDTIREGSVAAPDTSPPRLTNLSTRAQVGTGANILIPGFVIAGTGSEMLLIRADGPSLTEFSVTGVLSAPSLTVFDSSQHVVASNTGWGNGGTSPQLVAAAAAVGAFALPDNSADCALIVTLPAGAYTAQVTGVNGTTGVALAEIYEISSTGTRLSNISTRAQVGTGGGILIPGFYISGSGTENLLLRADGPSLSQFGVGGVLAQPVLQVVDSVQNVFTADTGWTTNLDAAEIAVAAASVGAFAFDPNSADSATIVALSPGAYTMQVFGVNGTGGVALAEVYELP